MNNDVTEDAVEATESAQPCALSLKQSRSSDIIDDLHQLLLILISSMYYLDCLAILYLLRFLGQNQIKQGGIRIVLTATVVSIATHALRDIPQPASREFWNHGGALVDFVGEKPTARFRLLAMDFLVCVLQLIYLTLWYKQAAAESKNTAISSTQDLEAEEAGISRAEPIETVETDDGIEMQSLLPDQSRETAAVDQDDTIVLRKRDLKEVFVNTGTATSTDASGAALRRFIERFNAVRARRAALQGQTENRT